MRGAKHKIVLFSFFLFELKLMKSCLALEDKLGKEKHITHCFFCARMDRSSPSILLHAALDELAVAVAEAPDAFAWIRRATKHYAFSAIAGRENPTFGPFSRGFAANRNPTRSCPGARRLYH